jgi:hypothetical protein
MAGNNWLKNTGTTCSLLNARGEIRKKMLTEYGTNASKYEISHIKCTVNYNNKLICTNRLFIKNQRYKFSISSTSHQTRFPRVTIRSADKCLWPLT